MALKKKKNKFISHKNAAGYQKRQQSPSWCAEVTKHYKLNYVLIEVSVQSNTISSHAQ